MTVRRQNMLSRAEGESVERSKLQGCPNVLCKGKKINRKRTQGRKDIYPEPMCVVLQRPKLIAPWPTNPPQQLVILLSPAGPVEHSGPRQSSALQNLDPELWAELGCITARATDTALPHNQSICLSFSSAPSLLFFFFFPLLLPVLVWRTISADHCLTDHHEKPVCTDHTEQQRQCIHFFSMTIISSTW